MTISIFQNISHEIEIKKSRFICQISWVKTEAEARDFISLVKKQHYKANHNCSAFILGDKQELQRSSDDGEPSGTAGVPMLEVLKKRELTDLCVVVTRYFGGIKLGAGGLIRAYAGSVSAALDEAQLVRRVEQQELILTMTYSLFDSFASWLIPPISEQAFSDRVVVSVFMAEEQVLDFTTQLIDKFYGKIQVEKGQKRQVELSI